MNYETSNRYNLRQEPNGLWTVYDIFTGEPAAVNGIVLDMLEMEDAGEWMAQLNLEDSRRRIGPVHRVRPLTSFPNWCGLQTRGNWHPWKGSPIAVIDLQTVAASIDRCSDDEVRAALLDAADE